jgi:hypothetical protein
MLVEVRNLMEDRLTDQVIIPLLEKMGFKNISLTHGPLEKGKSLWFYKENDFEEREYTGVQVKAADIHGSAGKTGNAGEIAETAKASKYGRPQRVAPTSSRRGRSPCLPENVTF